jgi:hypothetical protein
MADKVLERQPNLSPTPASAPQAPIVMPVISPVVNTVEMTEQEPQARRKPGPKPRMPQTRPAPAPEAPEARQAPAPKPTGGGSDSGRVPFPNDTLRHNMMAEQAENPQFLVTGSSTKTS